MSIVYGAVDKSTCQVVARLLEAHADAGSTGKYASYALMNRIKAGAKVDLVKVLLAHGADPEEDMQPSGTPLKAAQRAKAQFFQGLKEVNGAEYHDHKGEAWEVSAVVKLLTDAAAARKMTKE